MNTESKNVITIQVQGQDYKISCDSSEADQVKKSAKFLDNKLTEIRENTNLDVSKTAIIAALNITRDFLKVKNKSVNNDELDNNLNNLSSQIEHQIKLLNDLA